MPQVGNNNEPLHERAMFGFDGSLWKPLQLDASGYIQVSLPDIEVIEVTQDTAGDLLATVDIATDQNVQARNYGNIGGDWQKNPLLLGYSERMTEYASATSDGSSPTTASSTAVPAGEIHELRNLVAWHNNATALLTVLYFDNGPSELVISMNSTLAANNTLSIPSAIILKEGDMITVKVFNLTSAKTVQMTLIGTRVDIDL